METNKQIKIKKPSNISAFFICLLIATALWILHSLNTVYTKQFVIPIEFINSPHNKMIANETPKEMSVSVKASGLKLFLIGLNEPFQTLQLDLNETRSNQSRSRYYLSSNTKGIQSLLKFKADIKNVYPDTIAFLNKAGTQKEVTVKIPLYIKYAQGYVASDIQLQPNTIFIYGEENDLRNVDTIFSAPIYLNDIKSSFNKNVNLLNSNSHIVLNKNSVELSVTVDKLVEREITLNVQINNNDPSLKYVLFPAKVKLKLTTAFNNLSDIDTTLLKASVKISQKRNNKLPINLSAVPKGIHIIDYSPKEVEFLIMKQK